MNDDLKQYLLAGKKNLVLIYILYLCGFVAPIFPLIGAVMAYLHKDCSDYFCRSHYIFTLRTFVISLGAFILSFIITLVFISLIPVLAFIAPVSYFLLTGWFILRVAVGFKYLVEDKAHPNPKTWLIR